MEFLLWISVLFALATTILFFWGLWKLIHHPKVQEKIQALASFFRLEREVQNPILTQGVYAWENYGVLNPAAVVAGGRVHLFYRAVGADGVSRIGYSSSSDGSTFDERLPYPVYQTLHAFSVPEKSRYYSPVLYPSGGSWGGCEDPRAVIIEDTLYITYNMFDGWDHIRVGMISLSVEDLLNKRWNWSRPVIISPTNQIHKNWVLFPEKIGGKFGILHSIYGVDSSSVRVEYDTDFETFVARNDTFESADPKQQPDESIAWHMRMRSAGPPPIKTSAGWLVFYHATDAQEPHRYKLGAMLLDNEDPTRVIARSPYAVLSPDAPYENEGKPGIVYACGAIVRDDTLFVYYGGGDSVVCVATAPLQDFIEVLIKNGDAKLTPSVVKM